MSHLFRCPACRYETKSWAITCPRCGRQDSLAAVTAGTAQADRSHSKPSRPAFGSLKLSRVPVPRSERIESGFPALDDVLGGGFTRSGCYLIAGAPGAGKSTLALQCAGRVALHFPTSYISGEEPLHRIAERAARLALDTSRLDVHDYREIGAIKRIARRERPRFMVVDSLQTIYSDRLRSRPGSPSQLVNSASQLCDLARELNCAILIVGHVTKDNNLSGPRNVEHTVDVMLYFHAEADGTRNVVVTKNRFGPSHVLATFHMSGRGLSEPPAEREDAGETGPN